MGTEQNFILSEIMIIMKLFYTASTKQKLKSEGLGIITVWNHFVKRSLVGAEGQSSEMVFVRTAKTVNICW
jgi:hypothetical protein